MTVNGVTTQATYDASTNSVPSQLTVGSLTQTTLYNSFLGPSSIQGPNADVSLISYANISRPSSTTNPYSLATNYTYGTNTTSAVVNGRWTRTTMDGLGRTIKVENGTGNTPGVNIVSQTDTAYDSCGCSPLGKMKQVSLPHASGAGAIWTTYTYDGIGRTLSVLQPDGASTSTYSYQGNVVTVTDPAGAWKKYTSDAFGRLTQVEEPNPAGGSFFTTYAYDVLDHLILVTMARPTGTQTRTFNYIDPATSKPGALLRYAINPENGTVTYTYDSQNRLSTVIDAKNQKKVLTYDSYSRVTQVQRYVYSGGYVEDPMARTNFYFDTNPFGTSTYVSGRLAAVQYYGGHCSSYVPSGTRSGCDLIQESYSYDAPGATLSKTLKVTRGSASGSLTTSWTYDTEGRPVTTTYPTWSGNLGSQYTYAYDSMGRLNTLTDTRNTRTLVSGMTYGVANEALGMTSGYTTGVNSETHTYNSMFQLTRLQVASALDISYNYSGTQNNGKITSESDALSGEQVAYTYDALNRLASAQTTQTGGTQWGLSYNYDGFGNLTDQNFIKGSVPTMHVTYNASNNLQTGDTADSNGNIGAGYIYDIENRLVQPGSSATARYAYDAGNKRIWRGDTSSGLDEITFWAGKKLATYGVSSAGGVVSFTMTSTRVYFGGKMISTGTYVSSGSSDKVALAPVLADRQGSIKKFYPFGVERPSASANDTEKFTGYFRDASTGLDYADQRYHQPGGGRFITPDPSGSGSNLYAYADGDPVNKVDRNGLHAELISWSSGSCEAMVEVLLATEDCGGEILDTRDINGGLNGPAYWGQGCAYDGLAFLGTVSSNGTPDCGTSPFQNVAYTPSCEDQLVAAINKYTAGTPLANLGSVFVKYGELYDVDPRVVVGLANAESSLGRNVKAACNAWGYFWKGYGICSPFDSLSSGIQSVTHNVRRRHINEGQTNTTQLYSVGPWRYCWDADCSAGIQNLSDAVTAMGGSPSNLLFPCDSDVNPLWKP